MTGNPPLAERQAAVADCRFLFCRARIDCGLRFVRVASPMHRWVPILGFSTGSRRGPERIVLLGGAFLGMVMPENGDAGHRFAHC